MAFSLRGFWKSSFTLVAGHHHLHHPHRLPAIRSLTMATSRLTKEFLNELRLKNPYYEKYAEKIAALQKTSPHEFLRRLDEMESKKMPNETKRDYSELLNPKKSLTENVDIPHKKLSDIMKLELVADKSAEEIAKIWFEYHKTKDVIAATLTVEQYETLMSTAKKHPIFVLPLPRSVGFEFIMLQFANNTVHFTPLIAYQVHTENAPECLTMVHYTEFMEKGLILMRGEYDHTILNGQEAQCLANELQMFYFKNDPAKLALLDIFTNHPDKFKHTDLINVVENIQLI